MDSLLSVSPTLLLCSVTSESKGDIFNIVSKERHFLNGNEGIRVTRFLIIQKNVKALHHPTHKRGPDPVALKLNHGNNLFFAKHLQ